MTSAVTVVEQNTLVWPSFKKKEGGRGEAGSVDYNSRHSAICRSTTQNDRSNTFCMDVLTDQIKYTIGGLQLAAILVDIAKHVHNSTRI